MNFDSFWWAWQGQKICLACMPCIALCVENWPICHYANCTAILLLQMSFVTKNADIFDSFLEMHDRLPNIVWRKLLITLKKVVTFHSRLLSFFSLLPNQEKKKLSIFFCKFQNFLLRLLPCRCHWTLWWNHWFSCSLPNGIDYQAVFT